MCRSQVRKLLIGALFGLAGVSAHADSRRIVDPRNLAVVVASNWVPCYQTTLAVVDITHIGLNGPGQLGWRNVVPVSNQSASKCPMGDAPNQKRVKQMQNQIQAQIARAIAQKRMVSVQPDGKIVVTSQRVPLESVVARTTSISSASDDNRGLVTEGLSGH